MGRVFSISGFLLRRSSFILQLSVINNVGQSSIVQWKLFISKSLNLGFNVWTDHFISFWAGFFKANWTQTSTSLIVAPGSTFLCFTGHIWKNSCYELYELRSKGVNADRGVTQQCTVSLTVIEAVEIEINSHNVCILELEQRGGIKYFCQAQPNPSLSLAEWPSWVRTTFLC